jgi:diacylglycerol kinase family enzyme
VTVLKVAEVIGDYKTGNYRRHPDLATHLTGKEMAILSREGRTAINIDGEVMMSREVRLSLSPRKIRFIFPRGARWESTFFADPL